MFMPIPEPDDMRELVVSIVLKTIVQTLAARGEPYVVVPPEKLIALLAKIVAAPEVDVAAVSWAVDA